MKKFVTLAICLLVALSFSVVLAAQYKDQQDHSSCKYCGMDRTKFAHSRMLVEYQDGEQVGTCSLHCTTKELKGAAGRDLKSVEVADYYTHELVKSDDAFWVVGGDKKGVMTMRAKWAFATAASADKFVAEHGGERMNADQAKKASHDDMAKDMERMRKMKAMKKKKMAKE
jgi:copper chaperone NosL